MIENILETIPLIRCQISEGLHARYLMINWVESKPNEFSDLIHFFVTGSDISRFIQNDLKLLTFVISVRAEKRTFKSDHLAWLGDAVTTFIVALMSLENSALRVDSHSNFAKSRFLTAAARVFGDGAGASAESLKALLGASFILGGVQSAEFTVRKSGLVNSQQKPCGEGGTVDLRRFFSSVVVPAVIRLEATIALLRGSRADVITIHELNAAREKLVSAANREDLSNFQLLKLCKLEVMVWLKLVVL